MFSLLFLFANIDGEFSILPIFTLRLIFDNISTRYRPQ